MRLDQLIGVRDQREGGAHGICDGDFEVALRFLADHLRLIGSLRVLDNYEVVAGAIEIAPQQRAHG